MFILDSFLIFVLDKVAAVVDGQLNDDTALREQLMTAQMRLELGEISQDEFAALESEILARLRDIRERRQGVEPLSPATQDLKVTGVEATFEGDEH
jgi:hypothetical protein